MTRVRMAAIFALVLLAAGLFSGRRALIRALFLDGEPGSAPELHAPPENVPRPPPVARVRVVLVDGLSATVAHTLPHLSGHCRSGLDLLVDNGFPTVSLPVQHVLWTGQTQQQSGVQYRIAPLPAPPAGALPAAVEGSVAVAESHPEIVESFGFVRTMVPTEQERTVRDESDRETFMRRAVAAVTSDTRLAFVHVLAVDEAGHASGRASPAYQEAVTFADDVVRELVAADHGVHGTPSTWLVLSDHGHRADGGHGGAEPEIRHARACLWGPGVELEALPPGRSLHLVDLSRALFDLLGQAPALGAGRPLPTALSHPDPDATLPRARPGRGLFFLALVLGAAVATWRWAPGIGGWPWWAAVAYLGVVFIHGVPSLSVPAVYPPLGRDLLMAASPGILAAFLQAWWSGHERAAAAAISLLLLPLTVVAGLTVLVWGLPPLLPRITAELSVWLTVGWGGAVAVALGLAGVGWRDRGPSARISSTPAS